MNSGTGSRQIMLSLAVAALLVMGSQKRARADSLLDVKTLYYEEDGDRIKVVAPSTAWQSEWGDGFAIRVEGIYNSISGATPTGAPAAPRVNVVSPSTVTVNPVRKPKPIVDPGDDEDDDERDDKGAKAPVAAAAYNSLSGATPPVPTPTPTPKPGKPSATPTPTPTPSTGTGKIPTANFDDTRVAGNVELSKKIGRHTPSLSLSYSHETDYLSRGVAVKDSIDFNKKNTTLLVGAAGTFDDIEPEGRSSDEKTTVDVLVGVTQVLDPVTLVNLSATVGRTDGYLTDPYKVVELNGVLVGEKRPDTKDKQILYGSMTRYFEPLNGSLETGYRFYNDSFGIQAHTLSLAWYQKLGEHWMVRPLFRYYTQSEADFYGVRFAGSPGDYSSDYRLSEMSSYGGGLKVIWSPNSRVSVDLSYERYQQQGLDNETPDELYPAANMIMVGVRLWF